MSSVQFTPCPLIFHALGLVRSPYNFEGLRAFASFEAEPGMKLDQVYNRRLQKDDFGEDEKFDPKHMPRAQPMPA